MSKFLSRKFISALLYIILACLNYFVFEGAIPESIMITVAVVLGVYNVANVANKSVTE